MENNFLGINEISFEKAKFIILPVPYEVSTSFIKGTSLAPSSIISVSEQLEFYDEQLKIEPYISGIKTLPLLSPALQSFELMKKKIKKEVQKIIEKDKFLIVIGGEHTISVGVVEAYKEKIPDLKILILDAHADLREKYQDTKYSHACVTRRIVEMGFEVYVIGVRSISKEEVEFIEREKKVKIFCAYQMEENWPEKIQKKIPEGKYYLSIDADFFDPSVISEVGNPEPGGFGWKDTILFLEKFISRKDIEIIGFDFVELSPEKTPSVSSFISAKLIYRIIGLIEKYQK